MSAPQITVAVAGATGLVGRECVAQLAEHPAVARVYALGRRPLTDLPERAESVVVDYERLTTGADPLDDLVAVTHLICALGTTMKQVGSQEAFRRVDHDYVLAVARAGAQRGARHFLLVSALGADPDSRVFYNRVKGEVEQAVRALPFRSVTIVRPSLLLGEREEFRLGEEIGKRLSWIVPSRWKPVHAAQVAATLVAAAVEDRAGVRVLESREIRKYRVRSAE